MLVPPPNPRSHSDLALHDSRSREACPCPGWPLCVSRPIFSPSAEDGMLTSHQLGICRVLGLRVFPLEGKAQV